MAAQQYIMQHLLHQVPGRMASSTSAAAHRVQQHVYALQGEQHPKGTAHVLPIGAAETTFDILGGGASGGNGGERSGSGGR